MLLFLNSARDMPHTKSLTPGNTEENSSYTLAEASTNMNSEEM